jgi:DMSO/TMAO reductase YedYZ molybdopterin-dependent catalytic subunit
MINRRQFLNKTSKLFITAFAFSTPLLSLFRKAFSNITRTVLHANTSGNQLMVMNPKEIDSFNISVTPLKDFRTMGITDHVNDVRTWRLKIHGKVAHPVELTFPEIQKLPAINKKVLMICPGFFANQGIWKGVNMKALLDKANLRKDAEKIVFYGSNGAVSKMETFPIADILAGDVFLAYNVNGVPLPRKHGYPLRVVAGDYYGDDWVKYVYELDVM